MRSRAIGLKSYAGRVRGQTLIQYKTYLQLHVMHNVRLDKVKMKVVLYR